MSQWQGMLVILACCRWHHRQHGGDCPDQPQAHAGVLDHLAHGLSGAGHSGRHPAGLSASLFYAVVYVLMSLAGFGVLLLLSRAGVDAKPWTT